MATSTRPSFDWEDPFLLRNQLTDEERMVTDSARQFFQKELMPGSVEANRNENFDRNIMRQMGEMGLLGVTIEGYGCAGLSSVAYGLIAKEVEAEFTEISAVTSGKKDVEKVIEVDNLIDNNPNLKKRYEQEKGIKFLRYGESQKNKKC